MGRRKVAGGAEFRHVRVEREISVDERVEQAAGRRKTVALSDFVERRHEMSERERQRFRPIASRALETEE